MTVVVVRPFLGRSTLRIPPSMHPPSSSAIGIWRTTASIPCAAGVRDQAMWRWRLVGWAFALQVVVFVTRSTVIWTSSWSTR